MDEGKSGWRVLTIIGTVLLTISGYLYTHFETLEQEHRQAQLERVNDQLRLFYGPLFAFSRISFRTWEEFQSNNPGAAEWDSMSWDSGFEPGEELERAWRQYISQVQEPYFSRIEAILLEHSDLLEEQDVPEELVSMYAHISGYRVLLSAWESGDFSAHRPRSGYPPGFDQYAADMFSLLKSRQRFLIGEPTRP